MTTMKVNPLPPDTHPIQPPMVHPPIPAAAPGDNPQAPLPTTLPIPAPSTVETAAEIIRPPRVNVPTGPGPMKPSDPTAKPEVPTPKAP